MALRTAIFFLMLLCYVTCYLEIFQTKNCNFSLIKSENNPKYFTFSNCSRNVCQTWLTNPQNKTCINQTQNETSSNWQICMINCCNDGTLSQSYQSLNTCYNKHIQKDNTFTIILSVLSLIVILVICGILSCRPEYLSQKMYNSPCSLCNDKKLNLKIWCNHHVHANCFNNRLKKYESNCFNCPVCNEYVYNMKLYCKICRKFIGNVNEKQFQKLGSFYKVCQTCINQ